MKHQIVHDLDEHLARRALVTAFETYRQRFADFGPTLSWADEKKALVGFRVGQMQVKGTVHLMPRVIDLDLDVPLIFFAFKKRAVAVVEQQIRLWLTLAKSGALG